MQRRMWRRTRVRIAAAQLRCQSWREACLQECLRVRARRLRLWRKARMLRRMKQELCRALWLRAVHRGPWQEARIQTPLPAQLAARRLSCRRAAGRHRRVLARLYLAMQTAAGQPCQGSAALLMLCSLSRPRRSPPA